ncbi:MAG: hypothetical protein EHM70_22420 [Chloroflexota bacterium]|nr:MAG: hypothetical protein EHM70_22420 [Chloroflexota bacterium]
MDEKQMLKDIVEQYAASGCEKHGEIKVQRVQDNKTTYVEPNLDGGRSVYMKEYKVNGQVYWAGYSSRSGTVYLSLEA